MSPLSTELKWTNFGTRKRRLLCLPDRRQFRFSYSQNGLITRVRVRDLWGGFVVTAVRMRNPEPPAKNRKLPISTFAGGNVSVHLVITARHSPSRQCAQGNHSASAHWGIPGAGDNRWRALLWQLNGTCHIFPIAIVSGQIKTRNRGGKPSKKSTSRRAHNWQLWKSGTE